MAWCQCGEHMKHGLAFMFFFFWITEVWLLEILIPAKDYSHQGYFEIFTVCDSSVFIILDALINYRCSLIAISLLPRLIWGEIRYPINCCSLSGGLLYDVHLDKWTGWLFPGDSSAWVTYLGYFKIMHMWPWKGHQSLSLFPALLQICPFGFPFNTDWYGVCCGGAVASPISCCLLLSRLRCVYQPG